MSEKEKPKLSLAEENPWYVLATICDNQNKNDKGIIVNGRAIQNCEVWNSWAWARFQENGDRGVLKIKTLGLILGPKWEGIRERVEERLKKRLNYDNFSFLYGHQINLDSTIFTKKVEFTNFIFPFTTTFKGSVIFSEAVFHNSIFYSNVYFNGTKFNDIAEFVHTVFCGITHFTEQVDFKKNNTFAHSIFYYHVNFSGAIFRKRSNFRNCEFKKTCDFAASIFAEEYPWLEGTYFNQNFIATAHKYNWPNLNNNKQPLHEARASCEIMRAKMEAQGLHEQAHFFFRRERHFAVKMLTPWQRLPNNLFACLSAYGFSLKRPLRALALLWALPMLIFWVNICTGKCANTIGAELWISLIKMAGLSIANIFQITGLQRVYWSEFIQCLPSWLKFLGGAQTLLAIPLLFLLLLGLRNRFRLK
jgi:uncharacterized protein YjbI with pentapeptide repeats